MTGLTLLNIDREDSGADPLKEIGEVIVEIQTFISMVDSDAQPARLVPLKMKLRRLQDLVGQFGSDGSIPVNTKQEYIMELHPDLQMLANQLAAYGNQYAVQTEICMNFLLNHLCSTAASDPKSTVIGVSNVMAQVLSNDVTILLKPELVIRTSDPKYFEEFSREFNAMLTTAGLFAAPVLGLPDIPISALGGWADQALQQFSNINQFISEHFDPLQFYRIERAQKADIYDTTTDIFSYLVYENEFLAALISRADLLSGLEFPGGFTSSSAPVKLSGTDEITDILADSISKNAETIIHHIDTYETLYDSGMIDKNENPRTHTELARYRIEAEIWIQIAKLAKTMINIFNSTTSTQDGFRSIRLDVASRDEYPPIDTENAGELALQLHQILVSLNNYLFKMFPNAINNRERFIQSSEFTKFRDYLTYIIHITAAHDILLSSDYVWTPWFLNQYRPFIQGEAYQYNPHGSMEVGVLAITLGVLADTDVLIEEGSRILRDTQPHLEFQLHHLLALEVLTSLSKLFTKPPQIISSSITNTIVGFLDTNQVNPQSMLFQKANLYIAMLQMFGEQQEFLRKENERYVAFDPFSWIQIPRHSGVQFPYIPLNTSIDNLNSN